MSKTEPLLGGDLRHVGIAKAAWKLEDAMLGRLVAQYPSDPKARNVHFQAAQAENQFGKAVLLMLFITCLETPSWCDTQGSLFERVEPSTRCAIPGVKSSDILLSNLPYLPPGWAMIIELILIVVIAQKLLLERKLQLAYFNKLAICYKSMPMITFGLCMCALELLDCVSFIVFRPSFRLAFIARTGYLCLLPGVQRLALCIKEIVGEFVSIAVFYAGTIVFFAWVAVVMFDDMEGEVIGVPVNKGFDSFRTTLNTMFVAGSTDDFVEVLMPTYTAHRAAGMLWFVFLVIVHVLLLNLVLDTLVAAYMKCSEEKEEHESAEMVQGIKEAFQSIQTATGAGEEMSKEVFIEFAREFSRSPMVRPIKDKNADIVFQAIDKDNSGFVDEREFFSICGVIQYDFWVTKEDSPVKTYFPLLWNNPSFTRFRGFVNDGGFDSLMNLVLLVNFALVITESVYDLNKWEETPVMENAELIFSLVYVIEVALKLCVWDFSNYWSLRANQFDFLVTWMLLISSVLDEMAAESENSNIKRYINVLRLLRLIRVLKQLKRLKKVQLMVDTIVKIVKASKNIMMLLGVVLFFFSTLSVQLWGGLIYKSNPALAETEFAEKKFWVLNFNDFASAFGVWVVLALREYMDLFPSAIAEASSIPETWIVFLIFYVVGVSIVFELVKAFTIEAFLELHKHWGKKPKKFEALDVISEVFKAQGMKLHSRESGDGMLEERITKALEELFGDDAASSEEDTDEEGHESKEQGAAAGH